MNPTNLAPPSIELTPHENALAYKALAALIFAINQASLAMGNVADAPESALAFTIEMEKHTRLAIEHLEQVALSRAPPYGTG